MKKYRVYAEAKNVYYVIVEADSKEEAIEKANDIGDMDEFIYDEYNSTGTNITGEVYEED